MSKRIVAVVVMLITIVLIMSLLYSVSGGSLDLLGIISDLFR